MRRPLSLDLYRAATAALEPLAPLLLARRARAGKEDPARLPERLGRAAAARPAGRLVWLHGASVGETVSLLPLVDALLAQRPDLGLLVTSGTLTSATLLGRRLPAGAIHQFIPVDGPRAAARFLGHWRPDLAVFGESELWPNLLTSLQARGVPSALVSARLSERSLKTWGRAPGAARALFAGFALVLAQDDATASALQRLGARDDGRLNLKLVAPPLPVDEAALARARAAAGARPVLLAASTHPGEDEAVLDAFAALAARPDRPRLVIVPRHPDRGEAVAALASSRGFRTGRQSAGDAFGGEAPVYVADRLGELGLWFRLASAALIGGSLVPGVGGHNPLEAARLGAPVLAGPFVDNWRPVYADLAALDACLRVDAAGLAAGFASVLDQPAAARDRAETAAALAQGGASALDAAAARLVGLLR